MNCPELSRTDFNYRVDHWTIPRMRLEASERPKPGTQAKQTQRVAACNLFEGSDRIEEFNFIAFFVEMWEARPVADVLQQFKLISSTVSFFTLQLFTPPFPTGSQPLNTRTPYSEPTLPKPLSRSANFRSPSKVFRSPRKPFLSDCS